MRTLLIHSTLFAVCVVSFSAAACGDDDDDSSCTVDADDAGGNATIRCDDGTTAVVKSSGGSSCSVRSMSGKKVISCDDGTSIEVADGAKGAPGADGTDGKPGAEGAPGANGSDGLDGVDGTDGADGTNGTDGTGSPVGASAFVVGPGLKVAITDVTIPADLHPVVSLSMHDSADHALDRLGNNTPGAVTASFVLAYLSSADGVVGEYVPYITATVTGQTINSVPPVLASATQPKADSAGTWTEVDAAAGTYTYRFNATLPSDYDGTKTHTLAVYSARTFETVQYAADPIFHFRPDGAAVTEHREIVVTETCNHCHDTLRVHGGSRRDLGLCITCHVEGMADPESGSSLEFKQMIHKIHRGKNLPSVIGGTPYKIVGYNNTPYDYSDITFPQAMENCTTCHQGGQDSDHWKTTFSRAACTSCHDRTSFAATIPNGFTAHKAGEVTDDALCTGCHHEGRAHIGPYEVDVTKVHVKQEDFPLRDVNGVVLSTAPEVSGAITGVTGVQSGQTPVITFTVAVDGAPYDILAGGQALSSLRFIFAGPTTDYAGWAQYTAQASSGAVGTLATTGTPGEFTWTASQTIDNIANAVSAAAGGSAFPLTGTMAVGMEGRLTKPATKPDGTQLPSVNHAMHNAVFFVAITDAQAVQRRHATVVENCNTCHEDLAAHGGSRNDPEYCVLCHNAIRDTITRMPAPAAMTLATTTNLRLSHMVHRIHTGKEGVNPYIAYTPSAPLDFSDVRFPGDRRNCEHCHVPGQYELPLPNGLLASRWSDIDDTRARINNYYMGATAAACTGCHDAESTAVHAATMSIVSPTDPTDITESCATCHGSGKEFGLDVVHARPGL